MNMIETVQTAAAAFWHEGFGVSSRLWPLYLIATLLMGYALFRRRRLQGSFLHWLMPRAVWTHASHIVDIKLFAVSKILSVTGAFQTVAVAALVAGGVAGLMPDGGLTGQPHPILVAALLLITGDLATYWVHRIHHETRILWPFHSVHHSAEVMTPITVYRKHPLYDVTKTVVHGALLGLLQGVLIGLFPGGVSMAALMGINAGYFLFNMLGANFRHSHIWLSYGRVLEHLLISPAQHQIHHSIEPRHHNTNYGEVLAVWDWMFGTLYVTDAPEEIAFGLGDAMGQRLPQRHDSLTAALLVPLRDSWGQIRKRLGRRRDAPAPPATPAR
ncbi:sterol desaturase family protein [Sedimentitalea sp. HM32M-2]|uniref:sterol desaturase family protein n=1 Tax=Sedimentitalea sp. HM32M-2 TaxID=3351566 RepID=UPI003645ABFB